MSGNSTRREALVAAGFTGLAAVAVAGFAKPEALERRTRAGSTSDASLLALANRVSENQAEFENLAAPFFDVLEDAPALVVAKQRRLSVEYDALVQEIQATRAFTPAGLQAKARVLLDKFGDADPALRSLAADVLCKSVVSQPT